MQFTGERFVPELHGSIELEHIHRYLLAARIADQKVVLDLGSGEGYGSAMLAEPAQRVIGIDISAEAVIHASNRYRKTNLRFAIGTCATIPLASESVDLVVSFETLEHHDQHSEMLCEVKRVLRSNGVLVISTPDRQNYSVSPGYRNPFHSKELFHHEFNLLLTAHFKHVAYFGQRIIYGSAMFPICGALPTVSYLYRGGRREWPGIANPTYWIAVASDAALPELASTLLEQPLDQSDVVQSWGIEVSQRDAKINELVRRLEEGDQRLAQQSAVESALRTTAAGRDHEIHLLNNRILQRDTELADLRESLASREALIARTMSNSWRITRPLRALAHLSALKRLRYKNWTRHLIREAKRIYRTVRIGASGRS